MGISGNFWDLLRPYAHFEGFDYLRDKRVAVDLSFWIIQHETAIKGSVLKPHLRLTFFRALNLFSKFGAYPVFVVDGTPSPLKSQTRIARFYRSSGVDTSTLPATKDGISAERNKLFNEWVRECVELLELLGIPVVKAKGEAEALCAQLNSEGYVDACITPDSDAFLFGAKCVIKGIKPNSREPFECYHMSDIEAGLGLKRKHLIAISLLVGNDYDSGGVLGIGVDKALRIVREFSEEEILEKLQDIGKGLTPAGLGVTKSADSDDFCSEMKRSPHCSRCGHPGNKRTHFKSSCEHCSCDNGCIKKPAEFRCECSFCSKDRDVNEHKKSEKWWMKVCDKIALGPEFPNSKIIELYLSDTFTGCSMSWETPNTEMLVDYMVLKLHLEASYVRKMMLPMLSTIFLREKAKNTAKSLLYEQYEFHSIQGIKNRHGHQSFVVRWRKSMYTTSTLTPVSSSTQGEAEEPVELQEELNKGEESFDPMDEFIKPEVHNENGDYFLLTDEHIGLVLSAFPDETEQFLHKKQLKESKKKKVTSLSLEEAATTMGGQGSITDFYRSTKAPTTCNSTGVSSGASSSPTGKRRQSASNEKTLSKSVRRRLLFG